MDSSDDDDFDFEDHVVPVDISKRRSVSQLLAAAFHLGQLQISKAKLSSVYLMSGMMMMTTLFVKRNATAFALNLILVARLHCHNLALGMTLNYLHRVTLLQQPGANDLQLLKRR